MTRPLTLCIATFVALGVGGCAAAPTIAASAVPAPAEPMDLVEARVFRAAVANFQELYAGRSILVDPRPIALTDRDFLFPRPTEYHDGRGALIAARLAILAELGVDTASAFPVIPDCHPFLSAPPPQRVVHGCPDEETAVILVDTVRAGAEPGTWILRVMPIIYRPRVGRAAHVIDLMVGSRDGAWTVLERRELVIFEK